MRRKAKPKSVKMAGLVFHYQRRKRHTVQALLWIAGLIIIVAAFLHWTNAFQHKVAAKPSPVTAASPKPTPAKPTAGDLIAIDSVQYFNVAQAYALAKQNYGATTLPVNTGVTKITFHYYSQDPSGKLLTEYARAYLPDSPASNLPIFGFAPGTTGIGSECAASVERPAISNWGNYDSHMTMYASQGFAAVTTDYEGMLAPPYLHHYMVGVLEGRAVLDSIRALEQLPQARGRLNTHEVFLGGYSQGGHAAFWADKLAATYAPTIKPLGVVGWGPVMSVSQTLIDVIHGANINWFGPYILYSYGNYYHHTYGPVLLPHWQATLAKDVPAHCINTDIEYWGIWPSRVYTPAFLTAAAKGTLATVFPILWHDMQINAVGSDPTTSAKLINSGEYDNVVLPSQQKVEAKTLCATSKGPVNLTIWPNTTHYNAMVHSLTTVLRWMHTLLVGGRVASTCASANPSPQPTNGP